jgi:4-amino-4-deoxy-L-arabinose transferase-like glycosyltransferase
MKTGFINKSNTIILVIVLTNIIIHLLVVYNLEYMRDELLYFSYGKHLAAGYATTPPLIGFLSFLIQNTIGYSLFAVRIIPALASGFIVYLTALICKELGGKNYAQVLSAVGILIAPFALRTFTMFQPVFIDLLFWTLVFLLLVRFVNTNSPIYLVYLGITAGFSLLNKYLIAILFFAILFVVLYTKHRSIYLKKQLYLGFLAGFIIFLPNLIWQISNDFPVFHHMSELNRTQLVHVDRIGFLIDQLVSPFFASFLTIAGLVYLFVNKSIRKYRFIGITILLVISILCLLRAKSYYTIGVFPFLIAAGSVAFERNIKNQIIRYAIIPVFVLLTLPILPITLPVYKADDLVSYFKNLEDKY